MITSVVLSVFTISILYGADQNTPIDEYPVAGFIIILLYASILSYFTLEKLIITHIIIYSKIHKIAFNSWQKFDMWYFRKYRKHSPLTENVAKIQSKIGSKMSKRKRRVLLFSVIFGLILLNLFVRVPLILDSMENSSNAPEIKDETEDTEKTENEEAYKIVVRGGG